MGYCDYHNSEKSGPSNGWYCNKAGRYVERSLYTHYCNDSIHCVECPIYDPGRAQREREKKEREEREKREREAEAKRREEEERRRRQQALEEYERQEAENRRRQEQARQSQSRTVNTDYSIPDIPRGGGSGGSSGCFLVNILGMIAGLGIAAVALVLVGSFLSNGFGSFQWNGFGSFHWDGFGFFRSTVTLRTTLPEDVSHRDISLELVSHDPEKDYKVATKKLKKDGTVKLRLEKGLSSVYVIHDGVKFSMNATALDGADDYASDMEYQQLRDLLCRMILIRLKDVNEAPVTAEGVQVQDDAGDEMHWTNVAENRIMVGIPEGWTGTTMTITVEGYEPLTVNMAGKDRLEGIEMVLQPIR